MIKTMTAAVTPSAERNKVTIDMGVVSDATSTVTETVPEGS